ncbi:MAG: shikimate dehydrogenase family protein [Gemmatimonadales bacterium]
MQIGGSTRVFALLGDPVTHSLSPAMQNLAFRAMGLDAVYVPMRCSAAAIPPLMVTLARQGGGGNVTIPHKEAAAEALVALGGPPLAVCNTFWATNGALEGAETDSDGILAALAGLGAPSGAWCIIGTGGSARGALRAARRAGAPLAVVSRSPERAVRFEQAAKEAGVNLAAREACQVVINCTPLGMADGDPFPLGLDHIPRGAIVLDLVYRRGETAWVQALREAGITALDGRVVLVEQGAASFELWFPGVPAPREVMRAAVRAALG